MGDEWGRPVYAQAMRFVLSLLALSAALVPVALAGGAEPAGTIAVRPVALDPGDLRRVRLGRLTFLGGWELSSRDRRFGGLSALAATGPGRLLALSDSAVPVAIDVRGRVPSARMLPTLDTAADPRAGKREFDSEALARDPATGALTVALEQRNMLVRYDAGLRRRAAIRPAAMRGWPINDGPETMAWLPGGRLLVIAERVTGSRPRTHAALLFPRDPLAGQEVAPLRLDYRAPLGTNPSDAAPLPDGRLIVLNRRATLTDGFVAVLTLVDPRGAAAGAVLEGMEIARLQSPLTVDNMEGVAVTEEEGRTMLWLVSDDNFLPFERTLLMKFRLEP